MQYSKTSKKEKKKRDENRGLEVEALTCLAVFFSAVSEVC